MKQISSATLMEHFVGSDYFYQLMCLHAITSFGLRYYTAPIQLRSATG
jgi:hypothetical protein